MQISERKSYSSAVSPSTVAALVISLSGGLRAAGVPVSTGETIDALTALAAVDISSREIVRAALRAALVKDDAHDDVFDRLFAGLFAAPRPRGRAGGPERAGAGEPPAAPDADDLPERLAAQLLRGDDESAAATLEDAVTRWAGVDGETAGSERRHLRRVLRRLDLDRVLHDLMRGSPDRTALERRLDNAEAHARLDEVLRLLERLVRERLRDTAGRDVPEPPRVESHDLPIMSANADELAVLRAVVRPLALRIATRLGRRRRRGRGHLDMRRTLRESTSSGGVPLNPRMRRRHPSRPDLVVLCDVSGSVARFAPFTLSLLHALHAEFRRVRSWVFIDGMAEVTDFLESAPGVLDPHRLLGRRGLVAGDGRSDYQRALAEFLRRWPGAVTGKTTVLVIGDARHHERAPALAEAGELRRLARRVYWFNPEPRAEWDTGDSRLSLYAAYVGRVFEVATLRQLGDAVTEIAY